MKKKVITKAGSERCQHLDVSLLSTLQKKKENRDFGFVLRFFLSLVFTGVISGLWNYFLQQQVFNWFTGILEFFTKKELGFPIMQLKIFLGDFCINQLGFGKLSEFFTFKSLIFRVCILFLSFIGNHWVLLFCRVFPFFRSFPK